MYIKQNGNSDNEEEYRFQTSEYRNGGNSSGNDSGMHNDISVGALTHMRTKYE